MIVCFFWPFWRHSCAVRVWRHNDNSVQLLSALPSCFLWHRAGDTLRLGPTQGHKWCECSNRHISKWRVLLLFLRLHLLPKSGAFFGLAMSSGPRWNPTGSDGFRFSDLSPPKHLLPGLPWGQRSVWPRFWNWAKVCGVTVIVCTPCLNTNLKQKAKMYKTRIIIS